MGKPFNFVETYPEYEFVGDVSRSPHIPFRYGKIYQPGRITGDRFEPSDSNFLNLVLSTRRDSPDCNSIRALLESNQVGRWVTDTVGRPEQVFEFHRKHFDRVAEIVKANKRADVGADSI